MLRIFLALCSVYSAWAFIGTAPCSALRSGCTAVHRNMYLKSNTWMKARSCRGSIMQRKPLFSASDRTYMSTSVRDEELVFDDFDQILEAIVIFQEVYGDCEIDYKFIVPADRQWPQALYGLRLGKRLEKLQSSAEFMQKHTDKVEALAQVGWDPRSSTLRDEFTVLMDSLVIYKSIYGDLRIPSKFVVPNQPPWPRLTRGQKLGVRVAAVRSAGRYVKENPARKAELDAIGFEWRIREQLSQTKDSDERFDLVVRALEIYKQHVDESLQVPTKFVVPEDSSIWPEELHFFKLGYHCNNIRMDEKMIAGHPERKQILVDMGFPLERATRSHDANKRFENIYAALLTYKQLHGDLMVPQHFVVPAEEPWPEIAWGIKLGARVTAIRSQSTFVSNSPERRNMLDALGFSWEMRSEIRKRLGEQEAAEQLQQADNDLLSRGRTTADSALSRRARDTTGSSGDTGAGIGIGSAAGKQRGRGQRGDEASDPVAVLDKLLQDFKARSQLAGQSTASRGPLLSPQQQQQQRAAKNNALAFLDAADDDADLSEMDDEEAKEVAAFDEELSRLLGPGGVVNRPTEPSVGAGNGKGNLASSANMPNQMLRVEEKGRLSSRMGDAAYAGSLQSEDDELELDALVRRQEAAKLALPFDPTRLFQPEAYRETAAGTIAEYMQARELSPDPKVRQVAHFEGHLTPQDFNEMMARPIDPQDVAFMKQVGYRILEFGPHTFEDVLRALSVYRVHHGDVNVPQDYVITEHAVQSMRAQQTARLASSQSEMAEDARDRAALSMSTHSKVKPAASLAPTAAAVPIYDDSLVGMLLGEAVASLRNGDIDGLEDPARRSALDALGFHWGDLSRHQRYRFMPMLLGLRIYKHLYGFPMPQSDFVVPDAPQWPCWMAGMPLGEWAAVVRIQQQMVGLHYPERVDMLNALEFLWWIPPGEGVPSKYYEPVQ